MTGVTGSDGYDGYSRNLLMRRFSMGLPGSAVIPVTARHTGPAPECPPRGPLAASWAIGRRVGRFYHPRGGRRVWRDSLPGTRRCSLLTGPCGRGHVRVPACLAAGPVLGALSPVIPPIRVTCRADDHHHISDTRPKTFATRMSECLPEVFIRLCAPSEREVDNEDLVLFEDSLGNSEGKVPEFRNEHPARLPNGSLKK